MLKTNIFAGAITNLTDARYFAARGAQYLSFDLDANNDISTNATKTAAIKEWIEGPSFIGAFQMTSLEDIRFLANQLQLDLVQLSPFISLEDLQNSPIGVPLIRELVIEQLSDLDTLQNQMDNLSHLFDFALINFEKNGITWAKLKENPKSLALVKNQSSSLKTVLAISHLPEETNEIIAHLNPYGLYLQGGGEEKTGFKSFDNLDAILDLLEQEDD